MLSVFTFYFFMAFMEFESKLILFVRLSSLPSTLISRYKDTAIGNPTLPIRLTILSITFHPFQFVYMLKRYYFSS